MNFRKKFLTGIGALVFVVLMALNVQLVNSPHPDQKVSGISLVELAAKADDGGEGRCCLGGTGYCVIGTNIVPNAWFTETDCN